jgi:hypothetical protein
MKNPDSAAYQKTVGQWKQLIQIASEVRGQGEKPWVGNTSVAYHYAKHRKDTLTNNADSQLPPLEDMSYGEMEVRNFDK